MPGLEGKTLGRYEIVDLLGAGGMGEVYRARDTQLSRLVAIKVITSKATQSQTAIDRFEREAKTVAQLSHPNILDIHDFGRDDGVVYAVTELLKGQDLRDRMRGSMLPLSKALEIGAAVANGLAAAHSKGIIHRDIKPENVFVTSTGQVKILDFGIAGLKAGTIPEKAETGALTESLTLTGDILGTVGYMSPEQLRGEKVDSRSDIFSLGCLLYEILTGHRAFHGETSHDTMLAILNRDPDPIADHRPDISPGIEIVIRRCLEKQPDERFESARDVAFSLQAIADTGRIPSTAVPSQPPMAPRPRAAVWAAIALPVALSLLALAYWVARPAELPQVKHLAVLDFEASRGDVELQQMACGLAEHAADTLSRLEQSTHGSLWTVQRKLARDWGYRELDALQRTFNISLAVTGEMSRVGDEIRLTLEVVDPNTGRSLRSRTIQALPGNLSTLQHEPSLALVDLLAVEIDESTSQTLTADTTNVMGVIEPYLRGRGISSKATTHEELNTAIPLLEAAAEADPLFDAPRLALSRAHLRRFELNGSEEEIDSGILVAETVLSHGRRVAEARQALAALHLAAGRPQRAIADLKEAIELEPFNADLQIRLAIAHQTLDQHREAEDAFNHAIYLRPGFWPDNYLLAVHYLGQGRYDAAAIQFRRVIQSAPEHIGGYNNLGAVFLYIGRNEEAKELFEHSMAINPDTNYAACSNLGTLYYWDSRFADAQAMFERAVAIDDSDYEIWGNLAQAYAAGHEPANAIRPFQRAIELAEAQLPGDAHLLTNLATYHAGLGNTDTGLRFLGMAVRQGTTDPAVIANIAEAFEDLDQRDEALAWVARAVENGAEQSRFENRPTLRALVTDERYRTLFNDIEDRTN